MVRVPTQIPATLGERLEWLLTNVPAVTGERHTRRSAAKAMGCSATYVTLLINGERDNPRLDMLRRWCAVFDMPMDFFVGDEAAVRYAIEGWVLGHELTTAAPPAAPPRRAAPATVDVTTLTQHQQQQLRRLVRWLREDPTRHVPLTR